MLKSYFKIIARNFQRNSLFSLINIIGLSLGISCFTIILLFVEYEFSYDTFHRQPENIYRIVKDFVNNDGNRIPDATTPPALSVTLRNELPEVEHVTRFFPNGGRRNLLEYKDKRFYELNLLRVDSSFFQVFNFPLVRGNKDHPFTGIRSMLITETIAHKYFGDENPVGKIIHTNINNQTDFEVSGVLKDIPENSHFTFDIVIPFESGRNPDTDWNWYSFYTYARLRPGTKASRFESDVRMLFKKHQPQSINEFYIQSLTDIHLASRLRGELATNGNLSYVRILLVIGVFVMVIAAINYVNLITARSVKRAKEVGVRKVIGALRGTLVRQFLFESIVMVVISFLLSVVITSLLLPVAQHSIGKDLSPFLYESQFVRTIIPLTVVLTGFLAGLYPAFYLSSFLPLKVLRGRFSGSAHGIRLRQALVVFQFAVSGILIIGFLIIRQQLQYISNKGLGFDDANIIMVPNVIGAANPEAVAEDFKNIHTVRSVARASGIIGVKNFIHGIADRDHKNHITLNFIRADHSLLPTLGIEIKDGQNFSPHFSPDSAAIILNQEAVTQLGLKAPIIGQQILWDDEEGTSRPFTIIGTVKDFHFASFHEGIKPFGFVWEINNGSTYFLKVSQQNIAETIQQVEKTWFKHNPDKPFDYSFQDEQMAALHLSDQRFQALFSWFTFLAIAIASLGLLGLVAALTESRTKEIGVRKVLGSSVFGIVLLLSKEFMWLIIVALIIASPLAYLAASSWLEGFAYRVPVQIYVFIITGAILIVLAFATICLKSANAAQVNPVDSLRNE